VIRRVLLVALLAVGCGRARVAPLPEPYAMPIAVPLAPRVLAARPIPPAPDRSITVCAGGDVMLGSDLDSTWLRAAQRITRSTTLLPDPDTLLAPVAPLVADADVVLLNVEGAIGEGPAARKCRKGSALCYAFRQPPAAAGALRRLAPHARVAGNVANNHAMDAGPAGFLATTRHLMDAGVHVVGADTLPALVPLPTGDTLAILGFSAFSAGPDARDVAGVARHVARAAAAHARVVVSLHMGAEGRGAQRTRDAPERFAGENRGNPVAVARAAVEAGADLVIGHGPHVLRAVEWRESSLVAYSLGNFVTFGPFSREPPLDRGAILCAVLDGEGRVRQADLRATRQRRPGLAFPDPQHAAHGLVDSLSRLDFPTTAARIVAGMVRRPPPQVSPSTPAGRRTAR
jgi:hypothetical protein